MTRTAIALALAFCGLLAGCVSQRTIVPAPAPSRPEGGVLLTYVPDVDGLLGIEALLALSADVEIALCDAGFDTAVGIEHGAIVVGLPAAEPETVAAAKQTLRDAGQFLEFVIALDDEQSRRELEQQLAEDGTAPPPWWSGDVERAWVHHPFPDELVPAPPLETPPGARRPEHFVLVERRFTASERFTIHDIASTEVVTDHLGAAALAVTLLPERQDAFGNWTDAHVGQAMALVLGDRLLDQPAVIVERLPGEFVLAAGTADGFDESAFDALIDALTGPGLGMPVLLVAEELVAPE